MKLKKLINGTEYIKRKRMEDWLKRKKNESKKDKIN
jgi:hypothetical protein